MTATTKWPTSCFY